MKINVGDYVRTKDGLIGKLVEKEKKVNYYVLTYEGKYNKVILSSSGNDSEVIKSSPDIIDLVEVGDYVNNRLVDKVGYNFQDDYVLTILEKDGDCSFIYEKDIKEIITRERIEKESYKVGEE